MSDITVNDTTIIERETRDFESKDSYNVADLIAFAAKKSGRNPFAIGLEMLRHSRGKSKLKFTEYVQYEMYDLEKYTNAERAEFISGAMHGKIVSECIDYGWFEVAGDKWLSSVFLAADDTPQPEISAVIDKSLRAFQHEKRLRTPEQLREFLVADQEFPLFCKFNNGRWSLGANVIVGADKRQLYLQNDRAMSYEDFFRDVIGSHTFLIQRFVKNHAYLQNYTPNTATVRMVNMWREDGLWTPHAILKLPSAENVADNFWRKGNLVCQLDAETGEVLTVVGKDGPVLKRHEVHPDTGRAIIGQCLPHWDEVRSLNERVAALHSPVRYSTQDIAIADDGPVLIEFNYGGAFELPQIASGKGFLTPEVREFFRSCGSKRV